VRVYFLAVCLLLLCSSAFAQYRCVENGKTVLTDRPCAGGMPPGEQSNQAKAPTIHGDAANSAYSLPSGTWRGQVQYQATTKGETVPAAMAVVPMTIEIDPQGKIKGSSPENGCKLNGIAAPGIGLQSLTLDITLSECLYPGFNRRFSGLIAVNQAQKYALLSLNGSHMVLMGNMSIFEIKGTMRR